MNLTWHPLNFWVCASNCSVLQYWWQQGNYQEKSQTQMHRPWLYHQLLWFNKHSSSSCCSLFDIASPELNLITKRPNSRLLETLTCLLSLPHNCCWRFGSRNCLQWRCDHHTLSLQSQISLTFYEWCLLFIDLIYHSWSSIFHIYNNKWTSNIHASWVLSGWRQVIAETNNQTI